MENTNPFENPVSKNEFNGFWIPHHNAKVMKQGLENNKAPFLPDASGNIKAEPVYNAGNYLRDLKLCKSLFYKDLDGKEIQKNRVNTQKY